jgi:hypothetical protein
MMKAHKVVMTALAERPKDKADAIEVRIMRRRV